MQLKAEECSWTEIEKRLFRGRLHQVPWHQSRNTNVKSDTRPWGLGSGHRCSYRYEGSSRSKVTLTELVQGQACLCPEANLGFQVSTPKQVSAQGFLDSVPTCLSSEVVQNPHPSPFHSMGRTYQVAIEPWEKWGKWSEPSYRVFGTEKRFVFAPCQMNPTSVWPWESASNWVLNLVCVCVSQPLMIRWSLDDKSSHLSLCFWGKFPAL